MSKRKSKLWTICKAIIVFSILGFIFYNAGTALSIFGKNSSGENQDSINFYNNASGPLNSQGDLIKSNTCQVKSSKTLNLDITLTILGNSYNIDLGA